MPVPMPAAIVLIVCKTVSAGPEDQNAAFTGAENLEWATEHSMMVCRRKEVQLYDQAVSLGADPRPFTMKRCQSSGMMLGVRWNEQHKSSPYRFWRVACPVPIVDTRTGDVIAWKMPECGNRATVICEVDAEI